MTTKRVTNVEPRQMSSVVEISHGELCLMEKRFTSLRHEAAGDPSFESLMVDTLSEEFPNLVKEVGKAFAFEDSLGILLVTGMPSNYSDCDEKKDYKQLREEVLREINLLGSLPTNALQKVICREAHYQVGWSHGKEKLSNDRYDTSKGSFYFNPLVKGSLVNAIQQRDKGGQANQGHTSSPTVQSWLTDPAISTPNVWPMQALPGLESMAMDMGQLICRTGNKIALLCDLYVATSSYSRSNVGQSYAESPFQLYDVLTKSLFSKARLLHYFADNDDNLGEDDNINNDQTDTRTNDKSSAGISDQRFSEDHQVKATIDKSLDDDWCGWHNDHGSLTGLVPAMYFDNQGKACDNNDEELPKDGGLYIKSRTGAVHRVVIPHPSTTIAFQVGETTQIMTGGILQATPHAVKRGTISKSSNKQRNFYTRETMAVFMEPEYPFALHIPHGKTLKDIQSAQAQGALPQTVRTLQSRYTRDGMTFGEFSKATFKAFS